MSLLDLAAKITLDASGYNKGINEAEGKASSFGSKLKTGLAAGAKVAAAGVAAVTAGVVALTAEMKKGISETASYGDNVDKMSQKMGITAEAYQEWDFVMQHCGASIESLKPSMKTLATAVETNSAAFEKLGISQKEIAEMSQEELFGRTIKSLQNVTNETERTYLTSQLLGRGATELGPLLNMTAKETEDMLKQAHKLNGVMSDEAVKASAAYADSLHKLQIVIAGSKRGIFAEFLPGVVSVMDGLTMVFGGDKGGVSKINEGIKSIVKTANEMLPDVMDMAGSLLTTLTTALLNNLPTMITSAAGIIRQLVTGVIKLLPSIVTSTISTLPQLLETAIILIRGLTESIFENLPMLVEAAVSIVSELANDISENLPTLIPQAIAMIYTLVESLLSPDSITTLIGAAIEIIVALTEGLINALPILIERAPEIVIKIVETIIDNLPMILNAAADIINSLWKGLSDNLPELIKKIPEIIVGIARAIADNFGEITEAGKNLVESFWVGIKNAKDWILGKIKEFIGDVTSGLKSFFGIQDLDTSITTPDVAKYEIQHSVVSPNPETLPEYQLNKSIQELNATMKNGDAKVNIENTRDVRRAVNA